MRGLRLLSLSVVLSGCGLVPQQLPPDSATSDVVLRSYLAALQAGDCSAAHALATETFAKGNGELCGALSVIAVRVNPQPATPSVDEAVYGTTLTTTGSSDGSIQPGDTIWFYDLKRQPNGAWRLVGGGSGP